MKHFLSSKFDSHTKSLCDLCDEFENDCETIEDVEDKFNDLSHKEKIAIGLKLTYHSLAIFFYGSILKIA